MALSTVILAAGQGTRMRSLLPKVLHQLAGKPLLEHVVDVAEQLGPAAVRVVYGYGGDAVKAGLAHRELEWHEQAEQLGTGHAVAQAVPDIPADHTVLVLYGDVPLMMADTLRDLIELAGAKGLAVLTVDMDDPRGYGRILRDAAGNVTRIVEEKDATDAERKIREINTGVLACNAGQLRDWVAKLGNDNAQGEYYLTDVIELAASDGITVRGLKAPTVAETLGINDKRQLAQAEAELRARIAEDLMLAGVTLADPTRIDVRGTLRCGKDVFIDANTLFIGEVKLSDGVHVGPNVVIRDSEIEDGTVIHPNCVIEQAHFGPECQIGPFARVRPETYLGSQVKLGNFVEVKKSSIAKGSKVNHLSYVGDTVMGESVNVGAGTITCNYDGANKHRTTIRDRVFIGSGTQLVAPVEIGEGATIGAGSVISKDAPAEQLTLERGKQASIAGWERPKKKPKN